jgi:hypothetical protein
MAHKGLDSFLNKEEKRLVDLDWLDIDPKEYDNMPFDDTPEYISEPKLQDLWDHSDDKNNFDLVPNVDMNYKVKNDNIDNLNNDRMDDVRKLFDFVKAEMMRGKTGKELQASIQERSNPEIIKLAFNSLQKLSKEQGLLGNVYIDPSIFKKCEDGAKFVDKKAKTAKYVLKMSKCDGCYLNKSGRCDIYKKKIASDIKYDENLFNFYSKHLTNVKGTEVRIASRNDLQNAFLKKEDNEAKVAEFKPRITESKEDTLEQKNKNFQKQFDDLQKTLSEVKTSRVAKDIGFLLVKGYDAKTVKDHISHKYSSQEIKDNEKAINSVLLKQGSLGKVYVDASLIPYDLTSDKEAREFFSRYAKDVKYILANCECATCVCKTFNKTIVSDLRDIPKEEWDKTYQNYNDSVKDKIASVYNKNPIKGLRLAYLQEEVSKRSFKSPEIVETYDIKNDLDTNEYKISSKNPVYFTSGNITSALNQGYPLSKIIKTGKHLGLDDRDIHKSIKKAFELSVTSINKYQVDVPFEIPKNVELKKSGKDIYLDLQKPLSEIHEISYNSSEAPVDSLVNEMGLKNADLDTSKVSTKKDDIEISGLDQFDIE